MSRTRRRALLVVASAFGTAALSMLLAATDRAGGHPVVVRSWNMARRIEVVTTCSEADLAAARRYTTMNPDASRPKPHACSAAS